MDDTRNGTGILFMQGIFTLSWRSEGLKDGGDHALAQSTALIRRVDKTKVIRGYGEGKTGISILESLSLFGGKGKETGDLVKGGNSMGDLPVPVIPHILRRVRKKSFSELGCSAPTRILRADSGSFWAT